MRLRAAAFGASLAALAGCAAPEPPPGPPADPLAPLRDLTLHYEQVMPEPRERQLAWSTTVIGPDGSGVVQRQRAGLPVVEWPVRLDRAAHDYVLRAVAAALVAELRPVRPDARRPPDSPFAVLLLSRDGESLRIEGPVAAEWRAELSLVGRALDAATAATAPYRAALPEGAEAARWTLFVTQALPLQWPVEGTGAPLVRYALASRASVGSSRVIEIAAPFARGIEAADGTVRIETLGPLRVVGTSGLQRMTPEEATERARYEEVAALLRAPLAPEAESLVRRVTCGWLHRLGSARNDIVTRHADFVRWLRCPYLEL